jgi:hypothetical protein
MSPVQVLYTVMNGTGRNKRKMKLPVALEMLQDFADMAVAPLNTIVTTK